MPPDAIDRAVAEARTTKRLWLWGSMGTALVAWLIVWWVSSHRGTMILPNGTVISYAGVHKGKKVSDTEFERDVYAYPGELVSPTPLAERLNRFIHNLNHPLRGYVSQDEYSCAPELLLLQVSKVPPSAKDFGLTLEDGFGKGQLMTNPHMPRSIWLNRGPLPMGSPNWKLKVRGENNQTLGELVLPHPSFKNTPQFAGKSPPLEAQNSKNVLKLVSARHSFTEAEASVRWRQVTLEFDASACPTLLPCQAIGVRVTDAWGNTGFSGASPDRDGKTIRAVFRMESGDGDFAMQSEDWHIKIALCRGYGASFKADELVVFDHFPPSGQSSVRNGAAGRLAVL